MYTVHVAYEPRKSSLDALSKLLKSLGESGFISTEGMASLEARVAPLTVHQLDATGYSSRGARAEWMSMPMFEKMRLAQQEGDRGWPFSGAFQVAVEKANELSKLGEPVWLKLTTTWQDEQLDDHLGDR